MQRPEWGSVSIHCEYMEELCMQWPERWSVSIHCEYKEELCYNIILYKLVGLYFVNYATQILRISIYKIIDGNWPLLK
jgi:hypothetical protein